MSLNRPSFPHSVVELLRPINAELLARLNSDAQPAGLWRIGESQFQLSRPGALQVIWSMVGGPISRAAQYHGPDEPAKVVGLRRCTLRAEIRTLDARTQGFTDSDIMLAEEVLRALILVWDHQRPADYDTPESPDQEEIWDGFNEEPGQRQILLRYQVTPQLEVHDDPWQFKTIEELEAHGEISQ